MRIFYRWLSTWLRSINKTPAVANQGQQGSIIIPMAGVLFVGLVLLGSVHLGYMFYMKRELQNAADTAAMSGARALLGSETNDYCPAKSIAEENARLNLAPLADPSKNTIEAKCGDWDPKVHLGPDHFDPNITALKPENIAVKVTIVRDQAPIMPFMKGTEIKVESVAMAEFKDHIAAFSVGPQLASLQDGILTGLLKGVGLDVTGTTLIDYRGLANVKITPTGLLKQLGIEIPADITVGDLNGLLDAGIGVSALFIDILDASVKAATESGFLEADVAILKEIKAKLPLKDLDLRLFTDDLKEGLFVLLSNQGTLGDPNQKAGLDAEVSLGSIADVILAVANKKNAISLGNGDGTLISLPGLLKTQALLSVIEAPAIGIGGIGTKAHSANVRLFLRLCVGLGGCGTSSSGLLKLKLDLPIVVELINATGELTKFACKPDNPPASAIRVDIQSEIAAICIGSFGTEPTDASHPFSFTESCTQLINNDRNTYKKRILDLGLKLPLLGEVDLLRLDSAVAIPALTSKPDAHAWLSEEAPLTIISTDPLGSTGTTLKRILDGVLGELLGGVINSNLYSLLGDNIEPSDITKGLVQEVWNSNVGNCNDGICRKNIMNKTIAELESNNEKLGQTLKYLDKSVVGALGDSFGSLGNLDVGGFVIGLAQAVANLLGYIIDFTPNNKKCYYDALLGGAGSAEGCVYIIAKALDQQNADNLAEDPSAPSVVNLGIAGLLLQVIFDGLDFLGDAILTPLLKSLGIEVAQVETRLLYLDCQPNIRLVY